ncbi:MAG: MBL fold metallo-hydrolase, partial [Pseudohongiellaceae bacterium]
LNLDHPLSQAAGIEDREESIDIYVYSLVHPEYGTFIVDSGVAESFANSSKKNEASWIVESFMNMSALDVVKSTKELKQELGSIDGVLLTHIHTDHIMGLPDLSNTGVYGGPNDAELSTFTHAFTQGTTDRLLRNVNVLEQWQFSDTGIIDIFGDGSLWAIHTPGHTPGATAYLANTVNGAELMIGDATHTRWGWQNGVEPGTYSHDIAESKISLARLKKLSEDNPTIVVHPGHQSL